MSTSTRVTRSKGESDGLSLATRMRQQGKKPSGMERGTALNTTFNAGRDQQQQMPTQMPQLPTQSPQADSVRRRKPQHRCYLQDHIDFNTRMPLPASPTSSSQPSRSSAPLFKEDKYSSPRKKKQKRTQK